MANYKKHLVGGGIAYFIVLLFIFPRYHAPITTAAEWLLFSLAGSLFPDIDIKSKGQRYFYWLILLILILLLYSERYIALSVISIAATIPMLSKHRGLFHKIWFLIGAPVGVWYIAALNYPSLSQALFFDMVFFIVGALSHLYLDVGFKKMLRI